VVSPLELGRPQTPGTGAADGSFAETLARAVGDVSRLQETSKDIIAAYLRGDPVELHQVTAAAEEASLSLDLLVEVRNKLTDAYRTLMNLQT
jgi:flagellar hook-basal body complex protein FliE